MSVRILLQHLTDEGSQHIKSHQFVVDKALEMVNDEIAYEILDMYLSKSHFLRGTKRHHPTPMPHNTGR